jgi:hypothetical protein
VTVSGLASITTLLGIIFRGNYISHLLLASTKRPKIFLLNEKRHQGRNVYLSLLITYALTPNFFEDPNILVVCIKIL